MEIFKTGEHGEVIKPTDIISFELRYHTALDESDKIRVGVRMVYDNDSLLADKVSEKEFDKSDLSAITNEANNAVSKLAITHSLETLQRERHHCEQRIADIGNTLDSILEAFDIIWKEG